MDLMPAFLAAMLGLVATVCPAAPETDRPLPPADEWKGTNFEIAHSAVVKPGESFDPSIHAKLTPAGEVCSEQLNAAIYRQDAGHAFESKAHFDNCSFDEALGYIQSLVTKADTDFSSVNAKHQDDMALPPGLRSGMMALGQALHAVQDFYSHSNYVELVEMENTVPAVERNIAVVDLWSANANARLLGLREKGLVSGRVWWSLPHKCDASVATHGDLAKDSLTMEAGAKQSPWRGTNGKFVPNHIVAYNLAHRATRDFLAWSGKRWPKIPEYCGASVRYILAPDRRETQGGGP